MTESTKDEPHILDKIYELAHDPNNIADAEHVGGLVAADTAALAPVILAPESVIASIPALGIGGFTVAAGEYADKVIDAYNWGTTLGKPVIIPLEASLTYGAHEAKELVNEVFNGITSIFSDPSNVAPPIPETPIAPVNDGLLVMDTPIPNIFDVPAITASETSGPAASSYHTEPENVSSSLPSIFDSTPSVIDSTPTWGTDISSHPSYEVIDASASHDSGSHDGGTGADS